MAGVPVMVQVWQATTTMKKTIKHLLACSMLLCGAGAVQAQGLEGVIVEEFHTITAADANYINNDLGESSYPIPVGAKVYRVYVDMAPGYKITSVFGSPRTVGGTTSPNPLRISTTTTFWNDDNFGGEVPGQTRRVDEGTMFDSYVTIGSTGFSGGAAGCGVNTQQLGIRRNLDTDGDNTTCGVYPGFTGNDGSVPGTAPSITYNISGNMNLSALTGSGNNITVIDDAWATLPNITGIDPSGSNVVLIGQFTTDGVFSFQINLAIADASNNLETYVHTTAGVAEVVSPFLTYPVVACNAPVISSITSNGPICVGNALQLNVAATGDSPLTYAWSGPNLFTSAEQNPTISQNAVGGTYSVTVSNGCVPNATSTVEVVLNLPPNAGTNGTLTICAGNTVNAAQLFAQLGGNPSTGGSWSPALAGAGVYTYTVAGTAPCVNATSTVTVSEQAGPNAGTNGSLAICAGTVVSASQLFAQLGGSPATGGSWSPALAGAGTYTYSVAAVAPCTGSATATITVTEQALPNAGLNGTLTICSTAAAQNLFAQLSGTPDANGTWSGPSPVVNGNYVPSTMTPGVYTYTVAATAPCAGNATATVTVTETATGTWYQDTDGDGAGDPDAVLEQCEQPVGYVANNNDGCPADFNKTAPGACGCGTADVAATYYADQDGDGFGDPSTPIAGFTCLVPAGAVTNNTDDCPTTSGRIGDACDDLNANTINDVIGANCACAGTLLNEDCEGVAGGTAQPGTPCNDNNPGTGNDTWSANCQCVGLPFDCAGIPGGTSVPGTPCNDNNPNTGNDVWGSDCVCAGVPVDCLGIPGGTAVVGSPCNDNNPLTQNDVYQANCTCAGTPVTGCTELVTIAITTDGNPAQTNWEIIPEGGGSVVCNGAGNYPASTTVSETCCLPIGCYALRVLDSAGDGIATGGYVLSESTGKRIIDNSGNFTAGAVSAISGQQGFCLPLGEDRLIMANCDKLDWIANKYVVATENPAVSAEWVLNGANNVQDANSGYEFWIFDPNGTYNFRRFRSHNVSDGKSPANATRANHMKINGWMNATLTPHIPQNVLLNIRVRGRVNGTNLPFGAACLFKVDPARAACPLVGLSMETSTPAGPSCDRTRTWGGGNTTSNKLTSNAPQPTPVVASSSVRYQFRFRNGATCIVLPPQTSPTRHLNWNTNAGAALIPGNTYQVDVRVSLNSGATWCIGNSSASAAANCADTTPWGPVCNITIDGGTVSMSQGSVNTTMATSLSMYPNPNRGDQLFVSMSDISTEINTVSMDIYDMTGKRISARTIAVQDGFVNQAVELNGELAAGMYLVQFIAGDKTFSERLVVQH